MVGETHSVLVEESDGSKLTGRLSQNILVHFEGDACLVGRIVDVKLTETHGFYYVGKINMQEHRLQKLLGKDTENIG